MDKKDLRKEGKQVLKILAKHSVEKKKKESTVIQKLFQSEIWQNAHSIAITLSMPLEFTTDSVVEQAWQEGKKVYVPRVYGNRKMEFFLFTQQTKVTMTSMGIREPEMDTETTSTDFDLIIVPGVVFHPEGYRIGFGGGYYDTFLEGYKGATCSLVFQEQLSADWEPDNFDLPVQTLFTDKEVKECSL